MNIPRETRNVNLLKCNETAQYSRNYITLEGFSKPENGRFRTETVTRKTFVIIRMFR